jgi:hypothetical protein
MIELVSGMPAPQFRRRIFVSAKIRAGSRFKRFLCFILIYITSFSVPLGVCVPQVKYHCSNLRLCPDSTLFVSGLSIEIFYSFINTLLPASCPDQIILITFGEECRLRSSSFRCFFTLFVCYFIPLRSNIIHGTLFLTGFYTY